LAAENERLRADIEALSQQSQVPSTLNNVADASEKGTTTAKTATPATADGISLKFNLWVSLDGFQGTFEEVKDIIRAS